MKLLLRTTYIVAGLVTAAVLGLAADYYWGTFGLVNRWQDEPDPPPAEELAIVENLDVPDVCQTYWTTIKQRKEVEPHSSGSEDPNSIVFARDIQPIFAEHCYECHGPDEQQAALRLDEPSTVFTELASGDIPVSPGDPVNSSLLARVISHDNALRMPAGKDPLPSEQVQLLRKWIQQGADWPDDARHWAFVPPERPVLPTVADQSWPRNAIDYYILDRLEREGLSPSPQADPATLVRRLSLDLTGLPPTPQEVDRFLNDDSPDSYERLVDRTLSSPHFGERWAVRWLDLARYADTDGFTYDAPREMWLYRDWVIDAFNSDKPFDAFTVEQLAGDLLPNASEWQKTATGFLRCQAVEADVEHFRFGEMVDRVNTLGTVWLGLSLGCAQCHDHKYDPITQKEYYQLYAAFNTTKDEVENTQVKKSKFFATSPLNGINATTFVVEELPEPPPTHVKVRGSFLVDGEQVEPAAPAALHRPACGIENRLGLACWVVDPANPLTSRVTVNRFWEAIFGTGLVRTSEDLGTRSEPPSHSELLDWLATEFPQSGWSIKSLLRLIVTSATYRQSSDVTPELRDRDPQNRLLARGPRVRVDAEFVRDIALAASGTLSNQLGGPSVFPPQPEGITENHLFGSFDWKTARGDSRYQRGLYTFWKRTAMYPSFEVFDARNRTTTCPRRSRSTTPLQALVTLNDPAFFESAVMLGRRMMTETGPEPAERAAHGFRLCLSRTPTDDELDQLLVYYREELQRFDQDPSAASALVDSDTATNSDPSLDVIEWAAWTMVANVLLNLDETITKG